MKKIVLTVTLNPAVDVTMTVARFRPRKTFRNCSQRITCGGKGINVSRVLYRLGVGTAAIGIAGGKTGHWLCGLLVQEGISHEFVQAREESRMNVTILDRHSGTSSRFLSDGPRLKAREIKDFQDLYKRWLRRSAVVVLSGRNACGAPDDFYARLIRLARRSHVPAVLDTSGVPLKKALAEAPFMIKPNRDEAGEALGCRLDTTAKIKKAVDRFHRFGIRVVVVSMGKDGAAASDGARIWHARPPKIILKNDVGCGDALLAGFIDAYLRKASFKDTLRWAVASGAANAGNWTPGLISGSDLIKSAKGVRLQEI